MKSEKKRSTPTKVVKPRARKPRSARPTTSKTHIKGKAYPYRDLYSRVLDAKVGGSWVAELPFHPTRKWRFDYACEEYKIAIEIDGGIYMFGRHSRGVGQKKDMEKMNAAAVMGWTVLHYIPSEKMDTRTFQQIYNIIKQRRHEQEPK